MKNKFGPGHYTEASALPFFSKAQLKIATDFVTHYVCAKNSLVYSKRYLGGIQFKGPFVGRSSAAAEDAFIPIVAAFESRVRAEFGDNLELFTLEFTDQSLKQKSRWHKDYNDGLPFLNVFVALDDMNETNGMTLLRAGGGIVAMKTRRNQWYSFDGSIVHCAGPAAKAGLHRRALMAVFRRKGDADPISLAAARYKAVLTRRKNKALKRPKPTPAPSTRVLRSRKKARAYN